MSVGFKHPDFNNNLDRWTMVDDCLGGAEKVRSQGTIYLPMPDPTNTSEKNKARYQAYKDRAVFINVVRRTLEGLRGAVFRKSPTVSLVSNLDYLINDTDQKGLSLEQLSKQVVGAVLAAGRHGLLVDFPPAPENRSRRDDQEAQYRAFISSYNHTSIINWRTDTFEGVKKLVLVVLHENYEERDDDGFGFSIKQQHRVLRLNDDGQYQQEVWRDDQLVSDSVRVPTDASGQPLNFIPFIFVGSENNDEAIDYVPLYDLAEINISHYRNSADFEEMCYVVAQPTLFVDTGDMPAKDFKKVNDDRTLTLGVRDGYLLGKGGKAELLQVNPSQLAKVAQDDKLELMVRIGARLITESSDNETATAARIKHTSDNSVLSNIVDNVSDALETALRYCVIFNGGSEDQIEFKLNKEFFEDEYTPQEVMADIQLFDRGFIGKKEVRDGLRKTGKIDAETTDEDLDERIDNEGI